MYECIPSDLVLVVEVAVLLLVVSNTAVTLTMQLLPGVREEMLRVVVAPLDTSCV